MACWLCYFCGTKHTLYFRQQDLLNYGNCGGSFGAIWKANGHFRYGHWRILNRTANLVEIVLVDFFLFQKNIQKTLKKYFFFVWKFCFSSDLNRERFLPPQFYFTDSNKNPFHQRNLKFFFNVHNHLPQTRASSSRQKFKSKPINSVNSIQL